MEVAEEKGSLQVGFLEENAWVDFAKSLISVFQEDENMKDRRGGILAVMVGVFQHLSSSGWGSLSLLVSIVSCRCLDNAEEQGRSPPNHPSNHLVC